MARRISRSALTQGPILKNLILFTLPILAGSIVTQLYNLTDSIIVGNYIGKEALAAVSATSPTTNIINLFLIGLSAGSTVVIGQRVGAGDHKKLQDAIDTIAILTLGIGAFITVFGLIVCRPVLRMLGTPDNIFEDSCNYMLVIFIGTFGNLIYNMGSGCLRGMGDSVWPFNFLCFCSVCNILLDLLMVVVFGWGVLGAAVATAVSQLISGIGIIFRINRGGYYGVKLSLKRLHFSSFEAKEIAIIGIPAGIQQIGNTLAALFVQSYVNGFGSDFIAANNIVTRIDNLANMPVMAMGTAVGTFVAQNVGTYQFTRIRKGINQSIATLQLVGIVMCGALLIASGVVPYLFNSDPNVVSIAKTGIFITAFVNLFHGIDRVLVNAMRGMGKSMVPMVTAQLGALSRVPVAYFLAVLPHEQNGIFWAMMIASAIRSIAISLYYFFGGWKSAVKTYLRKHPIPPDQEVSDLPAFIREGSEAR